MLFAASYQVWDHSAVSAAPGQSASSPKKTLTQTPTAPPTDPVPVTPGSGVPMPEAPAAPATGGGTVTAPDPATPPSSSPSGSAAATEDTIIGVATGNKQLKTLTAAIKAALESD